MAISQVVTNSIASGQTITSPTLVSPAISGTPTGTLVSANMPTGSVLQVVSQSFTTSFATTSTSPQNSGISLAITPKFSTSKILVLANPIVFVSQNGQGLQYVYGSAYIYRNATTQLQNKGMSVNSGSNTMTDMSTNIPLMYLDSPATTSSTTYNLFVSSNAAAFSSNMGWAGYQTVITLMEIAG